MKKIVVIVVLFAFVSVDAVKKKNLNTKAAEIEEMSIVVDDLPRPSVQEIKGYKWTLTNNTNLDLRVELQTNYSPPYTMGLLMPSARSAYPVSSNGKTIYIYLRRGKTLDVGTGLTQEGDSISIKSMIVKDVCTNTQVGVESFTGSGNQTIAIAGTLTTTVSGRVSIVKAGGSQSIEEVQAYEWTIKNTSNQDLWIELDTNYYPTRKYRLAMPSAEKPGYASNGKIIYIYLSKGSTLDVDIGITEGNTPIVIREIIVKDATTRKILHTKKFTNPGNQNITVDARKILVN